MAAHNDEIPDTALPADLAADLNQLESTVREGRDPFEPGSRPGVRLRTLMTERLQLPRA